MSELDHQSRVVREFYPPLHRAPLGDLTKEQLAIQDAFSFQKRRDWATRQRLVPGEVLEASDATTEERRFFLGEIDQDPEPLRRVRYYDLAVGEVFELPEVDLKKPVIPSMRFISRDRQPLRQQIRDIFKSVTPMSREQEGSMERQIKFRQRVTDAIGLAWGRGSDMTWTEWETMEGIRFEDGTPIIDDEPQHLPTYRRLVRASEVPVYQS